MTLKYTKTRFVFFRQVDENLNSMAPIVKEIIFSEKAALLSGQSLEEHNQVFLEKNKASIRHSSAAAEMMFLLSGKKDAVKILMDLSFVKNVKSLQDCIANHKTILQVFGDTKAAQEYSQKCTKLFPLATYFLTEEERKARLEKQKQEMKGSKEEDIKKEEDKSEVRNGSLE